MLFESTKTIKNFMEKNIIKKDLIDINKDN